MISWFFKVWVFKCNLCRYSAGIKRLRRQLLASFDNGGGAVRQVESSCDL
jgi:hypothetical protein